MLKYKNHIISLFAVLVLFFIGQVFYASSYVGERTVLYPKEEYTYYELIANKMEGYNPPQTIKELKEDNLIYPDVHVVKKTKTEVTWSKSDYAQAAMNELQEGLDKIDKDNKVEVDKITLQLYKDIRKQYLDAKVGKFKDNMKENLKLQLQQDPFLGDWEKEQPDCILDELNN